MKFKQFDNEHTAQAWERMKSLIKNCPTHGLTTWMIIQTFYARLNFSLRNLLDSAAGGTYIEGFCSIVNQKNSYGCEQESQDLI
jgi:hypothetical protein